MRTWSKIATTFLLILAMAPLCYVISFHVQQRSIRHRMREEMEHKLVHSIQLKTDKINWIRDGEEIELNDRMFDVKDIVYHSDGTATITGIFDEEETALIKQLKKDQDQNNSQGTKQLAQLFQILLAAPEAQTSISLLPLFIKDPGYPSFEAGPVSAFRTILTPPPQIG